MKRTVGDEGRVSPVRSGAGAGGGAEGAEWENALQQLPSCAWARVALTRLDLLEEAQGRTVRSLVPAVTLESARQRIEKAIEIDGRLPWAHLVGEAAL